MATGTNVRTYFEGRWHDRDMYVMKAADHGAWLGSSVFDGARKANGVYPDLLAHCERLNSSAHAMGIEPTHTAKEIFDITVEGLDFYRDEAAVYIRPMYWALEGEPMAVVPKLGATGFSVCLEELPMPPASKTVSLTTTRFERPMLASSVTNAKAGSLYPNNARMLREAIAKGFDNALVADALGNVAETATSNVFHAKGGEVYTPIINGTFLAGITRSRVIRLLRSAGVTVHETVVSFDDVRNADEVFLTGNMTKVMSVSRFDDVHYQRGPIAKKALKLYWDWALSGAERGA